MNCNLCGQSLAETDLFCTQCGATLIAELATIEAKSIYGRIQLYSTFVRIVHEEKKKVMEVADVPYEEIGKVSVRKLWWGRYLQILRAGETLPKMDEVKMIELPTTLNIVGADTKGVAQLYQELLQRCPQAEFSSCFDKAPVAQKEPVDAVPTAPNEQIIATGINGKMVSEKSIKTPVAPKPPVDDVPTAPSDQIIAIGINGKMVSEKGIIRLILSGVRGERVIAVKQIKGFEYSPATGGLFSRNGTFRISSDSQSSLIGANALSFKKKDEAEFIAIKEIIETEMAK